MRLSYILIFVMVLPITLSGYEIDGWYPVENWEIKVCSSYGGTASAQSTGGASSTGDSYMFKTTVTLQAQVSNQTGQVYEVAWYFRPMDRQQSYKVELYGPDGTEELYSGSASVHTGDSNYHAFESGRQFNKAKLTYETGSLLVPIV